MSLVKFYGLTFGVFGHVYAESFTATCLYYKLFEPNKKGIKQRVDWVFFFTID